MNVNREAIYSALFALVTSAADFATTGRRAQLLTQMQPSQMPALYQQQVSEEVTQSTGIPPSYTLHVDIIIYAQNSDPTQPSTPEINGLIDALEATLAPNPVTNRQTLGGLVQHCFISGKTDIFEGDLANRVAAVVPVQILTT